MTNRENWLDHALRRAPWRTQRQALALVALGFFVAIIIGALYVSQAANLSTTGRQLEELIAERNQLEQTNEDLRAQIAGLRSVPRLFQRARDLGFRMARREDIEYLIIEGYNPDQPALPTPAGVEVVELPPYDETFLGWLRQQWDAFTGQVEDFEGT
jgi:cell division protein FtsB